MNRKIDHWKLISNCNRFSFTIAFVTLEKESIVLQRIKIRFSQASEKGSKSVGRSNCVANYPSGHANFRWKRFHHLHSGHLPSVLTTWQLFGLSWDGSVIPYVRTWEWMLSIDCRPVRPSSRRQLSNMATKLFEASNLSAT